MAQPVAQKSFNSGEWAPQLYSRVDMQKYASGAALLRDWFVDYRGGASTRVGTKYVLRCKDSTKPVRLISFQASFAIGYILEFGEFYIRFHRNGAPVLETAQALTAATAASPAVFTKNAHGYSNGDWVYATLFAGGTWGTNMNGKYFIVANAAANTFQLTDLFGTAVNSTGWGVWSAGSVARVYTLSSPYAGADLALLKFAQDVSTMILCHPSYVAYKLVIVTATNWSLTPLTYGSSVSAPTGTAAATTLAAGTCNYSYIVTAVDNNGQESNSSVAATLANKTDIRTVAGSNRITWNAVPGAASYNIYRAEIVYGNVVPAGATHGYIGYATSTTFDDSNIAPDYSVTPPIAENPFVGAGVESYTVTTQGSYASGGATPTVSVAAPASGQTATAQVVMGAIGTPTPLGAYFGYSVGQVVQFDYGIRLVVATVGGGGQPTSYQPVTYPGSDQGTFTGTTLPGTAGLVGNPAVGITIANWGVRYVLPVQNGSGYTSAPAVTFSAGAAAATAVLGEASAGNPEVPTFFQQRLGLLAQPQAPQGFNFSRPALYYNFDVSNPVQADDAISGFLVTGQLNNIKSAISQTAGLLILTDGAAHLLNGGAPGAGIAPDAISANAQSFVGANDVPPIVANADILYVQAKGSSVRNTTYNFYTNVFTGTDISVLASHLFLGHQIEEWCWAEEPYKIVWAVRDDGVALALTFLKEQEFVAWTHSQTEDGDALFKSVATLIEGVTSGYANSVYWVVERTVNSTTVKYIEMFPDRYMPNGVEDAWTVDSSIRYDSTPATSFTGAEHLAGKTVTGLADGEIIPPFTMAADGSFTLSSAASKVTIGLAFTPRLQTLPLDLGEPTVQGKVKKITGVNIRVTETLGLKIGSSFSKLVPMKDLVRGNVSGMLTGQGGDQRVTDLVDGDAFTLIDATYTVPGQYCIEQSYPYPATITGVFPEVVLGDTK